MVPQPNLTVIVNTQGGEGNFYFDLQSYSGIFYEGFQDFYLQTENFTANTQLIAHQTTDYVLTQENLPGFKIKSINCSQDDPTAPEVSFSYQIDGVSFSSDQLPIWEQKITCIFDDVKINSKTPVLFVPGLMGTNVKEGNELLWADLDKMFNNIGDSFMDDLQFKNDLSPKVNGLIPSDVIRELETALGLVNFDYTKSLINEFKNQGYVENQDLFTFPYDWRYGVSGKYADGTTNSDLLAKKIQDIMAQTGSAKVDVVAHSLGGLIVKQYVINHPTDNYIGKAVFVGVPNTGSVKAAKALLEGDNFGIPWLADSEIKKISANMPAAYDLLPSQQYYDNAGSYIETIDQTQGDGVEKYLNHQESVNFLEGQGLNQLAINGAENLHTASFDNFDLRTAGINLYAIDGCKTATMANFLEVSYKDILGNQHTDYDNVEVYDINEIFGKNL